ncbi:MAG TPA: acyl-CoA dehydrogenase family protein [Terriglobales bacterium]|nr:acyl-CoA dehydrogenase family protein [Terriglobales bacterium]
MDFAFTEEHAELRQTVRRFLEDKSNEPAVRNVMASESGYDPQVWSQMAEQMGLQGLIVPESYGGAGLGFVELAVVLEEMGRALYCGPYLSSALIAVNALLLGGDEPTRAELLPAIASGEKLVTLAYVGENGRWDAASIEMRATSDGGAWTLDGIKTHVIDGHIADVLLVAARTDQGVALFGVEGDADGVRRTLLPTLDLTRKLARIELEGARAKLIGSGGDASAVIDQVITLAVAGQAAEQVGGAQRCLEMSTEFAKTRLQFGRPIGSFQAIKHRCADMLVEVEFAKSAAYHAAFRAAEGDQAELSTAAAIAKSYCSEAFFHAAADTIQIHGGMGFTWEHPAHLYFKRAKSSSVLFGDPLHHRERLAHHLGL